MKKDRRQSRLPLYIGIALVLLLFFAIGFAAGPLGKKLLENFGVNIPLPAWLSVPQPHPELPAETVFHIFGFPITNTIVAAWVTIVFLVGLSYLATHNMKLVPGRLQSFFEAVLGWLYDLCASVAGEKYGRRFFPIVATIFLFVGFNAWLGLLPGYGSILVHTAEGETELLRPANTDINVPLAVAFASFVFVEFFGLSTLGIRYLGKFFNFGEFLGGLRLIARGRIKQGFFPLFTGAINIFTGLLEALSELIRIVSFTFRLFGNMTAGEILLLVASFLIPWLFALPFYGLELLIGFLQALIFSGLTLIFLTLAIASHNHDEGH